MPFVAFTALASMSAAAAPADGMIKAYLDAPRRIHVELSAPVDSAADHGGLAVLADGKDSVAIEQVVVLDDKPHATRNLNLLLGRDLDPSRANLIERAGFRRSFIEPRLVLAGTADYQRQNAYVYPRNDLGATYTPAATTLKLWAPTAQAASVLLFDTASTPKHQTIAMARDANGIWSANLSGDCDGKYYLYELTQRVTGAEQPMVFQVNDPYAEGASANSGRTLIYDHRKTDPKGWADDHAVKLAHNVDAVIYEVHVRDFTINRNSGASEANRAKYLGMVESGTRSPEGLATGVDHLQELGVTHVHLLPTFDYGVGDETQKVDAYTWYDWGYDPFLYNTPEGSYATNANGTARQKEFKAMVEGFHRHGIGVVLDMVFNHTFQTGYDPVSLFDKIVPGYFYRLDANGSYANSTYCGNEAASEKPMVRKFIVDSIKYWLTEYHVDGFRFDLMGIEDRDTMLAVYREAKRINPNVLIYGEGWDMERVLPKSEMMTQVNVQGTGIAAFNDGIRDNIKGDFSDAKALGFIQGGGVPYGGRARFELNIKGQSTGRDSTTIPVATPNETVNYDSAHDDNCIWDKLQLSAPDAPEALRRAMDKLGAGIILTAQGVPFLHAGDEFLRSKNLNHNSFNSNDPRVNPIDWSLKTKNADVFAFYRGMIALRKAHPAFRMTDPAQVDAAYDFASAMPANVVAYVIKGHANGDAWDNILVIYNGNRTAVDVPVAGDWTIVANDHAAGTASLGTARDALHVAPCSLIVAHTDGPYHFATK